MKPLRPLLYAGLSAFVLWTLMFSPWTAPHLPFWPCMTISACLLTVFAFWQGGPWWKHLDIPKNAAVRYWLENIVFGIVIAAVLWGVFWVGDKVSQMIFPAFARPEVNRIYGMKDGSDAVVLSLLLLFVIGPAEEIFWRGYFQRMLALHLPILKTHRFHIPAAFSAFALTTALYAAVHLFSFNFMLVMAALVCGVIWGGLYLLFPNRFPAILFSHALWDAAVFIWFPI